MPNYNDKIIDEFLTLLASKYDKKRRGRICNIMEEFQTPRKIITVKRLNIKIVSCFKKNSRNDSNFLQSNLNMRLGLTDSLENFCFKK